MIFTPLCNDVNRVFPNKMENKKQNKTKKKKNNKKQQQKTK